MESQLIYSSKHNCAVRKSNKINWNAPVLLRYIRALQVCGRWWFLLLSRSVINRQKESANLTLRLKIWIWAEERSQQGGLSTPVCPVWIRPARLTAVCVLKAARRHWEELLLKLIENQGSFGGLVWSAEQRGSIDRKGVRAVLLLLLVLLLVLAGVVVLVGVVVLLGGGGGEKRSASRWQLPPRDGFCHRG